MKPNTSERLVRVTPRTHEKIMRLAGHLQQDRGHRVSANEAIELLIRCQEQKAHAEAF